MAPGLLTGLPWVMLVEEESESKNHLYMRKVMMPKDEREPGMARNDRQNPDKRPENDTKEEERERGDSQETEREEKKK